MIPIHNLSLIINKFNNKRIKIIIIIIHKIITIRLVLKQIINRLLKKTINATTHRQDKRIQILQ